MISCGEKQKLHLQPQPNGKAVSMNKQPINAQENADYTAARGLSYASGWFKDGASFWANNRTRWWETIAILIINYFAK